MFDVLISYIYAGMTNRPKRHPSVNGNELLRHRIRCNCKIQSDILPLKKKKGKCSSSREKNVSRVKFACCIWSEFILSNNQEDGSTTLHLLSHIDGYFTRCKQPLALSNAPSGNLEFPIPKPHLKYLNSTQRGSVSGGVELFCCEVTAALQRRPTVRVLTGNNVWSE